MNLSRPCNRNVSLSIIWRVTGSFGGGVGGGRTNGGTLRVEEDGVVLLDGMTGSRTVAGGRRTGRTDGPIGAGGLVDDWGLDVVDIEGFGTVEDGVFVTVDDGGLVAFSDGGLDGGL